MCRRPWARGSICRRVPARDGGQVTVACSQPWLEPVARKVKEAMVRPVARRQEEYEEQNRAIDAWAVEKVGAEEEEKDEDGRCAGWYKKEGQPTAQTKHGD